MIVVGQSMMVSEAEQSLKKEMQMNEMMIHWDVLERIVDGLFQFVVRNNFE